MKMHASTFITGLILAAAVAAAQSAPTTSGGRAFGGSSGVNPEAARAKPMPKATMVPASDFPGKRVSFKSGATLRQAFDSLGEQCGLQFSISGNAALEQTSVSVASQDKPLWQSLQTLLQAVDPSPSLACFIRAPAARGGIRVNSRFSASGAFLVSVNRVNHQVSTTPGQPERYNVYTSVMSDGTLRLSGVQYESTAKKAEDEGGHSLVSTLAFSPRFVPVDPSTFYHPAIIVLQPPAQGDLPKKIAVLEGVLPATFVTMEEVEVKMGQKVEKQYGPYAVAVSLMPSRIAGVQAQVALQYTADASVTDDQFADWQQQMNAAIFELFDGDGKSLPMDLTGTGVNRRVLSMQQNYPPRPVSGPGPQQPAPTGTPVRAVVHVPTGFKGVEIPYHFEDVALP